MTKCEHVFAIKGKLCYCVYIPLDEVDVVKNGCLTESGKWRCGIYKYRPKKDEETESR